MRAHFAALFLCLFLVPSARADVDAVRAAFVAGSYEQAAQAGEALGDPESLTLASRALLAQTLLSPRKANMDLLDRATRDAESALKADPKSVDARLSLAVSLGMKGRRAGIAEAWSKGYAQRGKRLIEQALALDPTSARAMALQGSWNLEVIRRAGKAGGLVLGAGYERGVASFEHARAAAPDDPAIAFQYALSLLSLDPAKHSARAADLLAIASSCRPNDAFETSLREEARRIGAVLASSGAMAAGQAVSERYL